MPRYSPIKPRYVYFLSDEAERIKIGISNNPLTRFEQIRGEVDALYPLACVRANDDTERKLHAHFRHERIDGEWFHPSKELKQFVKTLQRCENHPYWRCKTFREIAREERWFRALMAHRYEDQP